MAYTQVCLKYLVQYSSAVRMTHNLVLVISEKNVLFPDSTFSTLLDFWTTGYYGVEIFFLLIASLASCLIICYGFYVFHLVLLETKTCFTSNVCILDQSFINETSMQLTS